MYCPFCNYTNTKVVDSRLANEGNQVRRRRECTQCGERFSSFESAVFTMPMVVKSDGVKESFDDHKIRSGLIRATQKRDIDTKAIDTAIFHIKRDILLEEGSEIASHVIGEYVMDQLRKLDDVAYIRFASVYHSFNDIDEFIDAIDGLGKLPTPELIKRQKSLLKDNDK